MSNLAKRLIMYWPYPAVIIADGPYAYWRLNESAGQAATDSSGNERHGTYQPGVLLAHSGLASPADRYASLTGAPDSYVDVSSANLFCAGNAWSIECWFKVASYANPSPVAGNFGCRFLGNNSFLNGAAQAGFDWGIWTDTVSNSYYQYCADPTRGWGFSANDNSGIPKIGAVAYVAFTTFTNVNNQMASIYLNGQSVWSGQKHGAPVIQPLMQIGSAGYSMGAMNGAIGEVAVYDYQLSAAQVLAHYRAGI